MRRAQKEALADTETSTAKDTAPIPLLSAARSLLTASAAELASRSNVTNRGGASRPSQPSPLPTSARPTSRFPMTTAAGVTCLFSISTWLNPRSSKSLSTRPALYLSSTAEWHVRRREECISPSMATRTSSWCWSPTWVERETCIRCRARGQQPAGTQCRETGVRCGNTAATPWTDRTFLS
jgi:hypothetical protein